MKEWISKAVELLKASLWHPRQEVNELDWKLELSPNTVRLAQHLSAFSNLAGGGFLVFGVKPNGDIATIEQERADAIVSQLANISRNNLDPAITLDHAVEEYNGQRLLFIRIPESPIKPVHLPGSTEQAYIRSCATTRLAKRHEIQTFILHSRTGHWEHLRASGLLNDLDLSAALDVASVTSLLQRPQLSTIEQRLQWLPSEKFIEREPNGGGYVTNLGAVTAAHQLADFPDLSRKAIRVVVYSGSNKTKAKTEQEGSKGYAVGFQGLLTYLNKQLPTSEVIEQALRKQQPVYPEIALREIVANALIHQDFSISGSGPLIEVFDDRLEISNPGGLLPSKQVERLIGTQPESRNQELARSFRRYGICEERGSGLIKAGMETELFGLPPIEFQAGVNHFKVILYSPRTFAQMTQQERLNACLQHATLKLLTSGTMTNKSLRERLKMPEKQRSMVSVLIQEAIDAELIKPADPANKSRKYTEYVPAWA